MRESARYVKRVEWSDEDECFVGSCPGVIGPCCHGDDEVAVYRELCGIVDEWLEVSHTDDRDQLQRRGLPDGLPASLESGKAGYQALCSLAGLKTRSAKQAFRSFAEVKNAPEVMGALKGQGIKSKPLQSTIIAFYRSAKARSETWREAITEAGISSKRKVAQPLSIEFYVLSSYDPNLLTAPVDQDALGTCADLFDPDTASESWHRPALVALPSIRRDILDWQHQSEDRQRLLALVCFAAASILNQVKLIEWTVGQVPDLASEYEGLLASTSTPAKPTDGATTRSVETALRQSAEVLATAVRHLLDSPLRTESMFDEVARKASAVEDLRRGVLDGQDANQRARLINAVFDHIESRPDVVQKLRIPLSQLREHWEAVHLAPSPPDSPSDIGGLEGDLSRLKAELADRLDTWQKADAKTDQLWSNLSAGGRRDRPMIAAYDEQVAIADRLRQDVEALLSPTSHPFDFKAAPDDAAINPPSSDEDMRLQIDTLREDDGALANMVQSLPRRKEELSDDDEDVDARDDLSAEGGAKPSRHEQEDRDSVEEADQPASEAQRATDSLAVTWPQAGTVARSFWDALAHRKMGFAFHIARLVHASGGDEIASPPLIAACALAEHVWSPEGELVESYAAQLAQVGEIATSEAGTTDLFNLLVIAATLRPSLFAPSTGAVSMLGQVRLSLPPIRPIADAAFRVSQRYARLQGIDIHQLHISLDGRGFDSRLDELVDAVKGSAEDAVLHQEKYVPAQRIWKRWITSGLIHRLVQNVSDANVAKVQQIIDLYRDQKLFVDHVDETSASLRRGHRGDIDNRTVRSLRRSLDPMMRHAAAWLRLAKHKGSASEGFGRSAIAELKTELEDLRTRISQAKQEMSEGGENSPLSVALDHAADAADRMAETLDQTRGGGWQDNISAQAILTRELLLVPGIGIDLDYSIRDEAHALAHLVDEQYHLETLKDAFRHRLDKDDIAGTSLVCDWMAAMSDPQEDDLRQELGVAVASIRDDTDSKVKRLVGQIESAHAKGHVDPDERDDLAARLSAPREDSIQYIVGVARACAEVEARLAKALKSKVAVVRGEVAALPKPLSEAEQSAIEAALEAGNVAGAREMVYKLDTDEGIPDRIEKRDHLLDFLYRAKDIETLFGEERPSLDDVDRAARAGEDVGGLSFPESSESEPPSELLAPWLELSRRGSATENLLRRVFENLGFVNVNVEQDQDSITVSTAPLGDRSQCPLHQYGSTAGGKYKVLLNWRSSASDQLMQQATGGVGVIFALHFGHLRAERNRLREWSLERRRQIVVLDETLVLYLSTIGPGRMSALFDCTLPFTCAEPFVTTASLVPPELFYGRAKERQDIMDRYGSCFVYGGRQIGKTALLRSVEAEFNTPAEGRIAKWIDLKQNAIGEARPPGDVWNVVWRELNEAMGMLPDSQPQGRDALIERLSGRIHEWLNKGDDRQILLLLDEADAFLEADSRQDDHFRESTDLKGIMDSTQRRFKVVFCGLHNVLRTTARANHPLAHLGQPIGVGPLLSNGEWEEARNLIREPLGAIGCRFVEGEPDLYALAQTNYYPSLIQILGAHLTRLVRDRPGMLPYRVTVDDVARVFTGPARLAIREKFQLTLQLDERYEVIAYSMALGFAHQPGDLAEGIDRKSLLGDVLQWWKEGFLASGSENTPMPLADFEVLLDEMVELGVLRRLAGDGAKESHYTLRNLNILPLLGSDEEIEQALERERTRPSPFDSAVFRSRRDADDLRALLTSEQETKLLRRGGVFVLTGTAAANIARAEDDLGYCAKLHDGKLVRIATTDRADFVRQLTSKRPSAAGARDIYVVSAESPWGIPWLEGAVDVRRRVKRGERLRVVFVADPTTLWRTMGEADKLERVDWLEAGPWDISFLRRWCDDLNLMADSSKVKELMELSGGWPVVLETLDRSPEKPWKKKIQELEGRISTERASLAKMLGIDGVEVEQQIRQLLDYEGLKEADISVLESDNTEKGETLHRRLLWASRLRLVAIDPEIRFNSLVKRVLQKTDA